MIAGGMAFLLVMVLACGGSKKATITSTAAPSGNAAAEATVAPATGPAKVGDRVEAGDIALTVTTADHAGELGSFQKAGDGKEFVVVEVVMEALDDKAPYNPLYFKVKDDSGVEYTSTINTGDKALQSGELAKGDKVRGTVAFEVSKDAKGLVMSYKPLVIVGGADAIRVSLP